MNLRETDDFTLDLEGETSGQKYFGKFSCLKFLPHGAQLKREQFVRELLGFDSQNASKRARDQAEIIADIRVSLTNMPDWLKEANFGLDLIDDNIILEISNNIDKVRTKALEALKNKGDKARETLKESVKKEE